MGYIYSIKNKISGKIYIGQTIQDIKKRWSAHKKKDSDCVYLKRAFEKYGVKNFEFKIILICFDEDVFKYEIDYIKKFNSIVPNGYNISSGGTSGFTGCKHSEETKLILSEKSSKYYESAENCKKNGDAVRESLKNIDISKRLLQSTKWHEAIANNRFGHKKSIPVTQLDSNNNIIGKFESINEASRQTNINLSSILSVINGLQKKAGTYKWIKTQNTIEIIKNKIVIPKTNKKKVIQYDLNNKEIKRYDSINEAALALNCSSTRIRNNITGKFKSELKFIFKFDEIPDKIVKKYNKNTEQQILMSNLKGHKIIQYDLSDNIIKEYNSLAEAARINECSPTSISNAIKNDNIFKNYKWARNMNENKNIIDKSIIVGKKIMQYDLNNNYIAEFVSISEAARVTKLSKSGIIGNLKERTKHSRGFIWKYAE